ncbi:hypothetical protein PAXRUDRAFT_827114 [Paxillus rubicundulus Ve08.2h10]|uniref:NAD(P)-binding domain-containing protein n=1 Tax=Paxillus rubicundulus Ve08.2h10 TaxID=930991 RepID=A0A0D0DR74_9AGAM|nr:hypothetical protein PAXRUDRAFT_827114 [Paxillus rubicundulus Ve08.2h10]
MKLILTGVTGAAGIQIFRQAITDAAITKITVLSRRALPTWMDVPQNDKTEVIVLQDFLNYPSDLPARLGEHDACIWALGKSSVGLSEEEYTKITYDYTMTFAKQIQPFTRARTAGPFTFVFISGEGADQTEKSSLLFARIKGRTEKALLDLPPEANIRTHILRPAYFFPSKHHPSDRVNIRSSTARALDAIAAPIISTMIPSHFTPIDDLGLFAVGTAKGMWADEHLFRNTRMRQLLRQFPRADGSERKTSC